MGFIEFASVPYPPVRSDDCWLRVLTFFGNGNEPHVDHYSIKGFTHKEHRYPDDSLEDFSTEWAFRWFHCPLNMIDWADACLQKFIPDMDFYAKTQFRGLRPALAQTVNVPLHSRHMEPSCKWTVSSTKVHDNARTETVPKEISSSSTGKEANTIPRSEPKFPRISVYLPYMNWDRFEYHCHLRKEYLSTGAQKLSRLGDIHVRRTLDQYYYGSLTDTISRDADQTISKWTSLDDVRNKKSCGKKKATDDSLLLMVDQIWCWVVDDRTILTFFPSHSFTDNDARFTDLYRSIEERLTSPELSTIWDLYSLIIEQATGHLFNRENIRFQDLMETYRWATNEKAAAQTVHFQRFYRDQNSGEQNSQAPNNRGELTLTLEVADILDELKMIRSLVETQQRVVIDVALALRESSPSISKPGIPVDVHNLDASTSDSVDINSIAKDIDSSARQHITKTGETLTWVLREIDSIRGDAEYTQKMLLDLLNLKQAAASLAEARSAGQQSRAVMLFTVVTIIFLPLSFFTSFFGQNVREYTGDDKDPTLSQIWKPAAVAISVLVIVIALLCALLIFRRKVSRILMRKWHAALCCCLPTRKYKITDGREVADPVKPDDIGRKKSKKRSKQKQANDTPDTHDLEKGLPILQKGLSIQGKNE
ncbi:hypothetical protein K491DRAFT_784656 [Lophiostoma macrostomum CBS 122681]|uniref:Cora-domain-containing protein n=1 Tax=Lophiostoma macrostomum CBS 122681 TaxID=1314788 RepID=A0A6A6SN12_9PLEO|nr:hypothetical protein K491DRAFT_784656 [Lophiostoma macrostomum CBS 122681]